ncbi:hypothetical protein APY03_5429 [Variovorax sp. WDL1]|nr:hypothetical protein APY03_5429 [Variovorax sp. WDL1]
MTENLFPGAAAHLNTSQRCNAFDGSEFIYGGVVDRRSQHKPLIPRVVSGQRQDRLA